MSIVNILFVSDTHLGFDMPFRPRVKKTRRGPDFFRNLNIALDQARKGNVDCVVHGGDLLYRHKVPAELVDMALAPLKEIADLGIPVLLVPGNHERGTIPAPLSALHPNLHVFFTACTFLLPINGMNIQFTGFPYIKDNIRKGFRSVLKEAGWNAHQADMKFLCIHHCIEGSQVKGHTFRRAEDVIRARDLPEDASAVLSGHIHRYQVLQKKMNGVRYPCPVFYPGSVERTSWAERDEEKGYLILRCTKASVQTKVEYRFCSLPTRPMENVDIETECITVEFLKSKLKHFRLIGSDVIIRIRVSGNITEEAGKFLRAENLRTCYPDTNIIEVRFPGNSGREK